MTKMRVVISCLAVILLTWPSMIGFSQTNVGSLTGTVSDPSGAAVPGAQVVLTNTDTQTAQSAETDSAGVYVFGGLPLGSYKVTVTHPGFETVVREGIVLASGVNQRVDVALQVGQLTQKVTVTGAPPVLETRDTTYSSSMDTQTLQDLPILLSGTKRDPNQYLTALPGYQGGAGFQNQINGSLGVYNEVVVDGVPATDTYALAGTLRMPFSGEALAEFKVDQSPSADLPNSGGQVISYTTKSGTDQLHGSAYEYMRNSALDSRCFFCSTVTPDHQNEFGFKIGGPVYIPHVIDGRNKLFFFLNVGWSRYFYGASSSLNTIPTDDFKKGNFSALLGSIPIGTDPLGRPVYQGEIYDPSTTRNVTAGQVDPVTGLTATASGPIRDPYANNEIPSGEFSAVSQKFQSFYPEPNLSGIVNNYDVGGGSGHNLEHYWNLKMDFYHGKNHFSGLYWYDNVGYVNPFPYPAFFSLRTLTTDTRHSGRFNWARTITPNLVNELDIGADRFFEPISSPPEAATGASLIGLAGLTGPCTPTVNIAGGFYSTTATQGNEVLCSQKQGTTSWKIYENLSYVRGRHYLKFGASYLGQDTNIPRTNGEYFDFEPEITGLPGALLGGTGFGYASFLLGGAYNSYVQGFTGQAPRYHFWGLYAQDEFHATKNLTVTLGLRYDAQPVPHVLDGDETTFNPTTPNPGAGGLPGALTFMGFGTGRLNTAQVVPSVYGARNFAPRIGFAYNVRKGTVIRGNFAMLYAPVSQAMAGYEVYNEQGFSPTFSKKSLDGFSPALSWDQGFPLPPASQLYANFDPSQANGSATEYEGLDSGKAPRIEQVHFGFEQEIPGGVLLSGEYYGTFAHGITSTSTQNINQLNYQQYGSLGNELTQIITSAADAQKLGIPYPYPGFQGTVAQALTPFPQFLSINNMASIVDWSTYNSLQLKAQKRFSHDLTFLIGYTVSKELSSNSTTPGYFAGSPQDTYNLRAEKSVADVDMPQTLILNYTYALPIGSGKKLRTGSNVVDKWIIGGWSVAGVHTYTAGTPIGIGTDLTLPTLTSNLRADRVPGVPMTTSTGCGSFDPTVDRLLNPAAFSVPSGFTFGNTSRYIGNLRTCGYSNENVSFFKAFPIYGEKAKITFGIDMFNILNRVEWCGPNTDASNTSGFGTIGCTNGNQRLMQAHVRIDW